MSIALEAAENGQIRVRLDSAGERAVSDLADPIELIQGICKTAGLVFEMFEFEMNIELPDPKPEVTPSA